MRATTTRHLAAVSVPRDGHLHDAVAYAEAGWPVFPLAPRSKVPLIPAAEGGRGHHDGSTDPEVTRMRWTDDPAANIGARVPDGMVVIDVDPRNGGDESFFALEERYGPLPLTLTSWTGSGGWHLFYAHPGGELRQGSHRLGAGIDVKIKGYVVLPESVHPNGRTYRWDSPRRPVVPLPDVLADLMRPPPPPPPRPVPKWDTLRGPRPGDEFNALVSWAEILEPAGWQFLRERDGIGYWRRPGPDKTDGQSATTNAMGTDRLHVFTSSAPPLEADVSYSKFGAWALIAHGGDFAAAARALRESSCPK